ncbi:MAG: MBL fold metallo-hydrolase [Planctomycetes bacterium]|nr:MBL fold metallo-hydrolase [Planctomycetota bacterium]
MHATATKPWIKQMKMPGEGCLGYIVADEHKKEALVIDPRHDQVDEYVAEIKKRGFTLKFIVDTHTHADHLSGAALLKQKTGASYGMLAGTLVEPADTALHDGQVLHIGDLELRVLETPGHTPDSLTLSAPGHLFTGDTMLIGGAGRTDFMGGDPGALYDSFQKFSALPDDTTVWPGHDYEGRSNSDLGAERRQNLVFAAASRQAVIDKLSLRGPLPANMAEILTFNRKGSAPGVHVDCGTLADMLAHDEHPQLVDVRSPLEFGGEWIEGSWNIPMPELDPRVRELEKARKPVILVCRSGNRALMAAQVLERRGFKDYRILEGGVVAWRRAGRQLAGGRKRLSIERQVQIGAGTLMLTGLALGTFVNPLFYLISAFVGAGLTFAGLSGFCGMARVLMRMPWNTISPSTGGGTAGSCASGGASSPCAVSGGGCGAGGN